MGRKWLDNYGQDDAVWLLNNIVSNQSNELIPIAKNGGIIKASEVQIASINGNIINQTFAQTNKILELGLSDSLNGMTPKLMIKVKL